MTGAQGGRAQRRRYAGPQPARRGRSRAEEAARATGGPDPGRARRSPPAADGSLRPLGVDALLPLAAGNRAVRRLTLRAEDPVALDHPVLRALAAGRLTVGRHGDPTERQADQLAEAALAPGVVPAVRQPAAVTDAAAAGPAGLPLGAGVREMLETRLGADLSGVRVHSDGRSAAAADRLRAVAFTRGSDVYFARGGYAPHTREGLRVLTHEVAHTVLHRDDRVVHRQAQTLGGIRLVGPAAVLDRGWTWSVTAHVSLAWQLVRGDRASADVLDSGRFLSAGVLERTLARDGLHTVKMTGSIEVRESNLIMNDAYHGLAVSAAWYVHPPGAGGGQDPLVELLGVPVMAPLRNPLVPGRSSWNIVVSDISRSRGDSAQVGLHLRFTKDSSVQSQYGGSVGGASGSSSVTVQLGSEGAFATALRLAFMGP